MGYKDGGLMVAIQRFNQGGMAGNKTYHQFHDQYVPRWMDQSLWVRKMVVKLDL